MRWRCVEAVLVHAMVRFVRWDEFVLSIYGCQGQHIEALVPPILTDDGRTFNF